MSEQERVNASVFPELLSEMGQSLRPPVIVDLMSRALAAPDLLSLAAGFTDNTVLPRELVRELAVEICGGTSGSDPLQYGQNQGRELLRSLTGQFLAGYPGEQAAAFAPDRILVSNGSQQALYIAAQVLCDRGDIVLVEEPSYFVCLEMLKGLGIRAVGIPCDERGAVQPEGFARRLAEIDEAGERGRVKAVYLVSYFSNPSSRCLSVAEKESVAKVLIEGGYRIPVIEDAAYRDLWFEAPPEAPTVLSLPAFDPFPRLYLGTFTKPFATGLKIGFAVCDDPLLRERMLCVKGHQDFGSSHFSQALIERLLERGLYEPHLGTIRKHYAAKASVLDAALREGGLPDLGWRWEIPEGGLIFWLRGPEGVDTGMDGAFCRACIENGVLYVPGDLCFAEPGRTNCVRLATGSLDPDRLRVAALRFAAVAGQSSTSGG